MHAWAWFIKRAPGGWGFCRGVLTCVAWLPGRRGHSFVTAPNPRLLRTILSLCASQFAAAEAALDIASELAKACRASDSTASLR